MQAPVLNLRAKISQRVITKRNASATSAETHSEKLCSICMKHVVQYKCPKCHLAYCSAPCFQTHSTSCVDHFNSRTSPAPPRPEEIADLAARFESNASLSRGDHFILKHLATSYSSTTYTPWWEGVSSASIAVSDDVIPTLTTQHTIRNDAPLAASELSELSGHFSSSTAPGFLQYQILTLLLGYSIALRSSCGLWNDPVSCIDTLLSSCSILDVSYKPYSLLSAINHWCTTCTCPTLTSRSPRTIAAVLKDVKMLLSSRVYLCAVLLDCWLLACVDAGYVTTEAVDGISNGNLPKSSVLLPLLQEYNGVFTSRTKKNALPSEFCSDTSWQTSLCLEVEVYCEEYLAVT